MGEIDQVTAVLPVPLTTATKDWDCPGDNEAVEGATDIEIPLEPPGEPAGEGALAASREITALPVFFVFPLPKLVAVNTMV